ncbi:hypothetical protein ACIQMP_07915 [Streptomyces sp. NPDC091385]|uniref:hypothetical protein n=1 Tax=Streptomyces sp. NPDC091385 TaxID=3365997 RepID=UPI0037FB9DE9
MAIRATDISRYLGDAGHTHYEPDDEYRPGRHLAHADPNFVTHWRSGYHSEQADPHTVRTFHEGLDVEYRLRLYAIVLENLGHHVTHATHKGKPCLLVTEPPTGKEPRTPDTLTTETGH